MTLRDELRKLAQEAADCDDWGGVWGYVHWAEKSNDSGVVGANRYDDPDYKPLTGLISDDPDDLYRETIAACEDDHVGGMRARYIAAACPANILKVLGEFETLVSFGFVVRSKLGNLNFIEDRATAEALRAEGQEVTEVFTNTAAPVESAS